MIVLTMRMPKSIYFLFILQVIKMHQYANYKGHHTEMKGLPPYLPQDLVERLTWQVPDPEYWFTGQFVSYILRPKV